MVVPIAKFVSLGVEFALWAAIAVALYDRDWLLAGLLVGANVLLVISRRRRRPWPDEFAYWVLAGAMIRANVEGEAAVFFLAAPRALARNAMMLVVLGMRALVSDVEEVCLGAMRERYADVLLWFIRRGTAARTFAWAVFVCVGVAWPMWIFWVAFQTSAWIRWPYLVTAGGFVLAWPILIAWLPRWARSSDGEAGRDLVNGHVATLQAAAARRASEPRDGTEGSNAERLLGSALADDLMQRRDIDGLLVLLQSDDTMERIAATDHLAEMKIMRAADPLHSSLTQDDALLRMTALRGLGKLGATQFADDIFLIATTDKSNSIRSSAIDSLYNLNDPRTVQALRISLENYAREPHGQSRAFIKWTTERLIQLDNGAEAIPALKAAATQATRRDRRRLRKAVTTLEHGQPRL